MKIEVGSEWISDSDGSMEFLVLEVGNTADCPVKYEVYSNGHYMGKSESNKYTFLFSKSPIISIQEQAYDEGYDQAIDDLIEAGVIGESYEDYSDEDCSEYEFGDVKDDEEEYCFSKELDKILNGAFVLDTKTEGSERKHSHYFKDVRHLDYIDVYELNKLFPIDDDTDCILHARKKLLVCGGRGGSKDMITDITEARDTLNRYLQIEGIE